MKNNNEQFESFIRDFDSIRMTSNEKNKIYSNLVLFTHNYKPKQSPYFKHISMIRKTIAMALVLLLVVTISKPASAKSLPGELLYNVKIIHEKIEAATISKPEDRIDFEIKRAEIRIKEAVELAKDKKLDTTKQTKLAHDIKKHVEEVSNKIEVIKEESPEKALALNSNLKTTLKVNSKALEEVMSEDNLKEENIDQTKDNDLGKQKEQEEKDVDINEKDEQQKEGLVLEEQSNDNKKETKNILEEDNKLSTKLILDSIEEDIAKTETINNDIEDEIINEESKDIENIDDSSLIEIKDDDNHLTAETEIIDEDEAQKPLTDAKNEDMETATDEQKDTNIDENNEDSLETEVTVDEEISNTINEKIEIAEEINDNKDDLNKLEISENIESEITSLRNVLNAENRLNLLLNELSIERNPDEVELIKILLQEKKFGQAYIEIQNEIETLAEIKLSKELGIEQKIQE